MENTKGFDCMQRSTAEQEQGEGLLTSDPTLFQNFILIPNTACKLMTQFFQGKRLFQGLCSELICMCLRQEHWG